MKIINAFWEERNIGKKTIEVEYEKSDNETDFINSITSLKDASYIVIKAPSGNFELSSILSEKGFKYIESIIEISLPLKEYILPPKLVKLNDSISYEIVDNIRIDSVCKQINKGIFTTDRIAIDKNFGYEISNKRYSNWVRDEFNNNNSIFEIKFGAKYIGFFGIKEKSKFTYEIFLAGIYVEVQSFGLGFSIISKSIEEISLKQAKQIITHISTNNIQIMRLYTQLGFTPIDIKNVFIKHI
jgi:hypothetical protein